MLQNHSGTINIEYLEIVSDDLGDDLWERFGWNYENA